MGTRRGFRPVGFLPAGGNRSQAFFPAWENRSRARARTWNEPRACAVGRRRKPGARIARRRCARRRRGWHGKRPKSQGAELSFSGVSVRGGTGGPTFCVFIEVWRGLLLGKFPPGRREQKLGFLPARENRSHARARTRKQPRACAAQMQTQTRCAICPAQPRDLLTVSENSLYFSN